MMNKELKVFFTALSFYSRLPVPASAHQNNHALLPGSIRYLPVIGWITGAIAAGVYILSHYLFNDAISLLLSMVATVLVTGGFHEDGFADVCDGFGGGWTKEKILHIMKDSRVGTYGVVGLILLSGIKFASLKEMSEEVFYPGNYLLITGLFIVAQTLSRFAAITVAFSLDYTRTEDSKISRAIEKQQSANLLVAGIFTFLPLACLILYMSNPFLGLIIFPVLLFSFCLGSYFKKWIGGYTGDCLGAVQQLTEVLIYLSYLVIWKFI